MRASILAVGGDTSPWEQQTDSSWSHWQQLAALDGVAGVAGFIRTQTGSGGRGNVEFDQWERLKLQSN